MGKVRKDVARFPPEPGSVIVTVTVTLRRGSRECEPNLAIGPLIDRLDRVPHQVEQRLLKQRRIAHQVDRRRRREESNRPIPDQLGA